MTELSCFSCHKKLRREGAISRRDECEHCGADLHVCLNCRFHDVNSYNECRETSSDVVRDKDRSNYCDFFQVGKAHETDAKKEDLISAAEALFKKD